MNSDLNDKRLPPHKRFFRSFAYAFTGIKTAVRSEMNLQIHIVISVIVIFMGNIFSLSGIEWLFIFFAIGGVIALELLNTAIERVVNLVTEDFHQLAKEAKDIAAGAVLIYAIMSSIAGMIIFLPKIIKYLQ